MTDVTLRTCSICGSPMEYKCWVEHDEIRGFTVCGYVCVNRDCKDNVYRKLKPKDAMAYVHAPRVLAKEVHD
jgi:hypothetical protein